MSLEWLRDMLANLPDHYRVPEPESSCEDADTCECYHCSGNPRNTNDEVS